MAQTACQCLQNRTLYTGETLPCRPFRKRCCSSSALEPCTDCSAVETGVGRNVDNLFQWGMTVTVPENGSDTLRMEIGSEDGGDCAAFVHVQAEAGSELTLVQIWKADASHAALRTVIRAEAGATVRLVQILADASAECINDVGCVTGERLLSR